MSSAPRVWFFAIAATMSIGAVAAFALLGELRAHSREQTMATASDEAAIRALFDRQGEAWLREDGEAFASVFAIEADFINIRAHALRGRAEIARHHTQIFTTIYRGSKVRIGDLRIRFIRPDVATVEAASSVTLKDQTERQAHLMAVAVHNGEKWEIQALHNMVPFVPPAPPG